MLISCILIAQNNIYTHTYTVYIKITVCSMNEDAAQVNHFYTNPCYVLKVVAVIQVQQNCNKRLLKACAH